MKGLLHRYQLFAQRNLAAFANEDDQNLHYWQNKLFCSFLVYCLPISLIALLPGVFMALKDGLPIIAAVDIISFTLLAIVTFCPGITLRYRKIFTIGTLYLLAIFLINSLGYIGPGIFYLFFITVLSALIFPATFSYLTVVVNAIVLFLFAVTIEFKLFDSTLINEYTTGAWIAFSANLIFASIVIVLLIDKIFESLQQTITKKTHLQERYRQIFEKSPLPMWLFDTDDYRFVDVNEAAARSYGYSKAEFLNMTIMDIRYSENIPQTAELVKANKLSGKFYGGNSQHVKKTGEMIFVKIESNLLNLDGRQVRLVQATDITTQVEHQVEIFNYNQKIKESESNLRAIFDSVKDGFILLDARGVIKLFNYRASAAMEFNRDQHAFKIGRSIFDYVEASRLPYFHDVMTKVYNGEVIDYDRMFRADGAIVWIRYTVTPVREDGYIIGACITGRDVTERKFYIRSLEEQNKVFREISWMQSHLVRAPLASIMGLLPMLSADTNKEDRERILEYLNISAKELDNVIQQIIQKSSKIIE